MSAVVRGILIVVGVLLMLGGLSIIVTGRFGTFAGFQLLAIGALLVVVVAIERSRYRSDAAERANAPAGPGGGEPSGALEPRFRPTAEVFIDPTSGKRMRVLVDPSTGDRRYVAEG